LIDICTSFDDYFFINLVIKKLIRCASAFCRSSIFARRVGGSWSACLVPAAHLFEFNGTKSPEDEAGIFAEAGERGFCLAGRCVPMPDRNRTSASTFHREARPAI